MSIRARLSSWLIVALCLLCAVACGGAASVSPADVATPESTTAEPAQAVEIAPADTPAPAAEEPTETADEPPTGTPRLVTRGAPTPASDETLPADAPAGALPLEVLGYGFGVGESDAGWGLLVVNHNTAYALVDSRYTLTVFDAAGNAIHTEEGALPLILSGQMLGVGGALLAGDEEAIAALEVVVQTGSFVAAAAGPGFITQDDTFVDGTFADEVTGTLVNPYAVEMTDLRVSAVAFDAADNIIGGGTTILGLLPASGSAAVTVPVTVGGEPARVELFAVPEELPE